MKKEIKKIFREGNKLMQKNIAYTVIPPQIDYNPIKNSWNHFIDKLHRKYPVVANYFECTFNALCEKEWARYNRPIAGMDGMSAYELDSMF